MMISYIWKIFRVNFQFYILVNKFQKILTLEFYSIYKCIRNELISKIWIRIYRYICNYKTYILEQCYLKFTCKIIP